MSKIAHTFIVTTYLSIILFSIIILIYYGQNYYSVSVSERPFHAQYELLKPSGYLGHGYGIFGTLLIVFGMLIYIVRKRWKKFAELGRLKYWLEFHIFLCTIGTVLVVFHTTFKFGGIISVGFWVLILVWISGVVGRFLQNSQKLFRAWHIVHLPLSVIMIVIMVIHVGVVLFFGYKWIF